MAQDMMAGLFGQAPWEIQQKQYEDDAARAERFAQMNATQRGVAGMHQAGAGLGRIGAGMMGMVNPEVEQAKMSQAIMANADTSSPEGMMALAKKFNDAGMTKQALMLAGKAREVKAAQASAMLAERKQGLAEEKEDFRQKSEFALREKEAEARKEQAMATLEQRKLEAEQRSQDMRFSAEQRAQSAREATAARLQIAQLMASLKKDGTGSATSYKKEKDAQESMGSIRALETDLNDAKSAAEAIKNHPGLKRATGAMALSPSIPGLDASKAEGLIEEFKDSMKIMGLARLRQGGGIGAITEKEWKIIEGTIANIDPKRGEKYVSDQIDKVLSKMESVVQNAKSTHSELYGEVKQTQPAAQSPAKPQRMKFDANGNMVQQ